MIITHKLKPMDLASRGVPQRVDVMQDDKYSRNLQISLYENGTIWQIPSDVVAVIRYKKSDGTGGNYSELPDGTTAYEISGNVITIALEPKVCADPGLVMLAVGLIQNSAEVNTFTVDVVVQPNPGITALDNSGVIDTSDATATASDMASGKTAYVNGKKVTGEVMTTDQDGFYTPASGVSVLESGSKLEFKYKLPSNRLFRPGSSIRLRDDLTNLGDATAADVAAGKMFTSSAGLKVTGTLEVNAPPSGSITITENGTHDVTNYASAEVNVCGQYIWEKSNPTEWGVTSTDLGTTAPSDCGTTLYGTATITDDGHYALSGSATLGGYYYIIGAGTNPKSVYYRTWHYVHNGDSYYTYEKLTISDAPVSVGGLIGYVVSDNEAAYPDGGTQDGYRYVRVTVQGV